MPVTLRDRETSHAGMILQKTDTVTVVTDVTLFPEDGGRRRAETADDNDKGLSGYRIRQLANWYLEKFEEERLATGTPQQRGSCPIW